MIEIKDRKIQEMENNFFALHERVNDLSEFFCQLKENNIKEMLHTFNKVQKKKKIFEEPIVFKKVTKHWQKEVRNEKD